MDVIPEEIIELLEEAVETYAMLAPSLPPALHDTALKEIEFFMLLYQDKMQDSLPIQNLQRLQKLLDRAEAISPLQKGSPLALASAELLRRC